MLSLPVDSAHSIICDWKLLLVPCRCTASAACEQLCFQCSHLGLAGSWNSALRRLYPALSARIALRAFLVLLQSCCMHRNMA
jgi:hypothetical protein